ncbi:uncharacterized protein LOC116348254 [Contarinia nasturtii]|uniref:uncharacterized protein LOC116348254 n=1 Tax=Contarinia nasturtii TaxID=265458 RepID=UPI0012D3872E|nr:uncharacterized protein LOC116348254 [Contarinia nasturtii]
MESKLSVFFLFVVFQFCSTVEIPSVSEMIQYPTVPTPTTIQNFSRRSHDQHPAVTTPSTKQLSERFQYEPTENEHMKLTHQMIENIYPCVNLKNAKKVIDSVNMLRLPHEAGHLEAEEAEMDLLYIMVFGVDGIMPLSRWYLMFEKIVDAFDESDVTREDPFKLNELIFNHYLTPTQRKQLKVIIDSFTEGSTHALKRYMYGSTVGAILDIPHETIAFVLERVDNIAAVEYQLSRFAIDQCKRVYPYFNNVNVANEIMRLIKGN